MIAALRPLKNNCDLPFARTLRRKARYYVEGPAKKTRQHGFQICISSAGSGGRTALLPERDHGGSDPEVCVNQEVSRAAVGLTQAQESAPSGAAGDFAVPNGGREREMSGSRSHEPRFHSG